MPTAKLCVLVVSQKFCEGTQDTYGQRLPYVSPYLIDYSLKLFKHFKTKVITKYFILFLLNREKLVEFGLTKDFIGEECFSTVVIWKS